MVPIENLGGVSSGRRFPGGSGICGTNEHKTKGFIKKDDIIRTIQKFIDKDSRAFEKHGLVQ